MEFSADVFGVSQNDASQQNQAVGGNGSVHCLPACVDGPPNQGKALGAAGIRDLSKVGVSARVGEESGHGAGQPRMLVD